MRHKELIQNFERTHACRIEVHVNKDRIVQGINVFVTSEDLVLTLAQSGDTSILIRHMFSIYGTTFTIEKELKKLYNFLAVKKISSLLKYGIRIE